ncbi:aminotransferase class V-fold PLP-dependent enzyme [Streptomyces sp. NPDC004435]|uniref:aminotransferase class V-fold PLP-dependent enzyme n=1 Tax=Streptomyces sp. NPDC004435 TaxID=3364701 RepID=UPI003684C33F
MPTDSYVSQFDEAPGYLDFARVGPPSRAVVAETARLIGLTSVGTLTARRELGAQELRARTAIARLVGSDVHRVVLQPSTSFGLFQAAFGLPAGEVLVPEGEFPANTYPWVRAEQAGRLVVRWMRPRAGHVTADAVLEHLTRRVSAVAVSAVDYRTGHRAALAALREVVGERLLVVDAMQALGAVDEPWEVADILVCGGQKWLRSGLGPGFAVLSDRAFERMDPLLSGWAGAHDPARLDSGVQPASAGASAWSVTAPNPVASGALATALELLEGVGTAFVAGLISSRVARLEEALLSSGAEIVSATGRRGGILPFRVPGRGSREVGAALEAEGIVATVRPDHVRLAPHASTGSAAVDRLRAAMRRLAAHRG